jgi:hypothetical protein
MERADATELRPVPYHGDLNQLFDEACAAISLSRQSLTRLLHPGLYIPRFMPRHSA